MSDEPDIKLTFAVDKDLFFDRDTVQKLISAGTRRALSRLGAFVRTRARSSIRRARRKFLSELSPEERKSFRIRQRIAKKQGRPAPAMPLAPSAPGQPPRSHTGLLRDFILFAYDPDHETVVIGPEELNMDPPEVPAALEYGGPSVSTAGPNRGNAIDIKPRPFMRPALMQELPKLNGWFGNLVQK